VRGAPGRGSTSPVSEFTDHEDATLLTIAGGTTTLKAIYQDKPTVFVFLRHFG
jgi:hypothetical protein